jgi:hypothetical protein
MQHKRLLAVPKESTTQQHIQSCANAQKKTTLSHQHTHRPLYTWAGRVGKRPILPPDGYPSSTAPEKKKEISTVPTQCVRGAYIS